jgi:hypothetical protein
MGLRRSDGPRAEVRAARRTSGQRQRSSARGGRKESGGEAADERARAVSGVENALRERVLAAGLCEGEGGSWAAGRKGGPWAGLSAGFPFLFYSLSFYNSNQT